MNMSLLGSNAARTFLAAALLFTAGGCGDNLIGPENQLEVNNEVDTFQWQVTALDKVTQRLSYTWTMTGTVANVDQSAGGAEGSARLRIEDAAGTEVYSRSLREDGTFATSTGTAGDWRITVTLENASGAINFRLQKP